MTCERQCWTAVFVFVCLPIKLGFELDFWASEHRTFNMD